MASKHNKENEKTQPGPNLQSESDTDWYLLLPSSEEADEDFWIAQCFQSQMVGYFRPDSLNDAGEEDEPYSKGPSCRVKSKPVKKPAGTVTGDTAEQKAKSSRCQPFPPGRIPRGQPDLLIRRFANNLLSQLSFSVVMAESLVLPHYCAWCAGDKVALNRRIAYVIGLDYAIQEKLIDKYVICWPKGRYPKTAHSIRLMLRGGRRERAKALGNLEFQIRDFMRVLQGGLDTD